MTKYDSTMSKTSYKEHYGMAGKTKSDRREPKNCLGRGFNFKLGWLGYKLQYMHVLHTDTSSAENFAKTPVADIIYFLRP